MPVIVRFLDGARELTLKTAIPWLARAGYHLVLHAGEGLVLADFLARHNGAYAFLQQSEFMRELRDFANQGRIVGGAPPVVRRADPSTLGVHMGAPNAKVAVHARDRLDRQLRILSFVVLLRHQGSIRRDAEVTLATTTLQHGQGGEGFAAAHKAIAVPAFDNTPLHEISADRAVRTYLVIMVSETSVVPAVCNGADDAIERVLRNEILGMVQEIVSAENAPLTLHDFEEVTRALWSRLRTRYIEACKTAVSTVQDRENQQTKNYYARQGSGTIPVPQLLEAKLKAAAALKQLIVLDEYREKAEAMPFPFSSREMENMYNLVVRGTF